MRNLGIAGLLWTVAVLGGGAWAQPADEPKSDIPVVKDCLAQKEAADLHPEYQPHITITYKPGDVDIEKGEPYRGKIVLGPEIFEEVKKDWQASISEA
jgi:hypothetical protein